MRFPGGDEAGWRARLAAAGVPTDLVDGATDDREFALLEVSALRAAWQSALSDEDLYPLLARVWTGRLPTADWPPDAPAVARRCATRLAMRGPCEFDASVSTPSSKALAAACREVVDALRLTPSDLLQALTGHWRRLQGLELPIHIECTLLAFARHVLVEPVAGASALIWWTHEAPTASVAPEEPIETDPWPAAHGFDEDHLVATELARLGQREQRIPDDGAEAEALLASGRATAMQQHNGPTLVAASIVRTSGWPGDTSLITALANDAVLLASQRLEHINPFTDNETLLDGIQHQLTPPQDELITWAHDLGFATLLDPSGAARTGAEMLKAAADWLTWGLAHDAVEVMAAMRRESKSRS